MLKDAKVIPGTIGVGNFSDLASRIITPTSQKENSFYSEKRLCDGYDGDEGDSSKYQQIEGDPGAYYHEFCLVLGRIALDIVKGKDGEKKKDPEEVVVEFFAEIFSIRTNLEVQQRKELLVNLNRPFLTKLRNYYLQLQEEPGNPAQPKKKKKKHELEEESEDEEELADQVYKQMLSTEPDFGEFQTLVKTLDVNLPDLPEEPVVELENPPPYAGMVPKIYGIQPPKDKDKKSAKAGAKKAGARTKEKPIPWADMPQPQEEPHYKVMFENHRRLLNETNLFDFDKGSMSNIDVDPV
jgi:hypothetical protein